MNINPNQGQNPDQQDPYGAYQGYSPAPQPAQPAQPDPDDPYNSKWYGQQQGGGYTGTNAGQYGTGQQTYQQYGTGQQQQQQTYQPPQSAYRSTSSDPSGPSSMSMNPRIAALLSNALIWVGGLFFFVAERKNRFHCHIASWLPDGDTFAWLVLWPDLWPCAPGAAHWRGTGLGLPDVPGISRCQVQDTFLW